ncbi:MAG TPA: formylglycine-generating enzyme family protein [Planctomycetota bacterium]
MGPLEVVLSLLLQAEEVVDVPGEKLKIPLVRVPVEGTSIRPYAIAKYETTWKDFNQFYQEDSLEKRIVDGITRPSTGKSYFGQVQTPDVLLEEKRPAINMTWHIGMAYCDYLTAKTGQKFRLPTDAEWEHAARAGEKGAGPAKLDEAAWHQGNSGERTALPGKSKPNAWGLHDMLGNVWELVLEPAEPGRYLPVYRGGAWNVPAAETSYALRKTLPPSWFDADPNRPRSVWWLTNDFSQGFRVARVGDAEAVKASTAYAPKVEVKIAGNAPRKVVHPKAEGEKKPREDVYRAATVEVRNGGDRAIEELELWVYFLTPKGEPHLLEKEGGNKPNRPNYSWAHLVMAGGAHAATAKALGPGETRTLDVDVPETYDDPAFVNPRALGAQVRWIRF